MDEYPRRRRLQPQEPKGGGGIPILPLVVLVVFAGLLLGGLLAKVFGGFGGGASATPAPSFTPLPSAAPTATFAPRATPHVGSASPSPSPSASSSRSVKPSPAAGATALVTATPKPSVIYVTPAPKATASAPAAPVAPTTAPTQAPVQAPTPVVTQAPEAAATQVLITGAVSGSHAASIVRAYVGAVSRGDESTAAGYLAHGLPNESFLTKSAKITDLQTSDNGGGNFTVTTTISTPGGNYYETFTVQNGPYGMQITEHSASASQ